MAHHITINGRPLCDHLDKTDSGGSTTGADARICQHAWKESAEEVARVWRAFKGLAVAVEPGACPSLARRLAASQDRE